VPIRIGVNSGSLAPRFREYVEAGKMSVAEAMVASAREHIAMLEECDFRLIKVSLKSPSVLTTLEAHRLLAKDCPHPFHAGITEAGTLRRGITKSALGIGLLLMEGLADTIRVSLTAPPVEEVLVGRMILQDLGLLKGEPEVVSCPTCARREIDVAAIAEEVERLLYEERVPIRVAVMGCVVNGPGEARDAEIGVTGGKGVGVLFRNGEILRQVPQNDLLKALREEILKYKPAL
jgi:(E)-4-hydroxy-3-methylbut-2-enyl-diphosphate synthase